MDNEIRTVLVFRKGPNSDEGDSVSRWEMRIHPGMSVMDLLDDIARNIDLRLIFDMCTGSTIDGIDGYRAIKAEFALGTGLSDRDNPVVCI